MKNVDEINAKLEAVEAEVDALCITVEANPKDVAAKTKLANLMAKHTDLINQLTH